MNQLTNYKHRIVKPYKPYNPSSLRIKKKCSSCKKNRKPSVKDHQICRHCYNYYIKEPLSRNKVIDDFIKYTQKNALNEYVKMQFVPYYQFENIEFIAEGGFSKIYKATWIGGLSKIYNCLRADDVIVALKKLNNSKNITSKELNEVCTMLYTSN